MQFLALKHDSENGHGACDAEKDDELTKNLSEAFAPAAPASSTTPKSEQGAGVKAAPKKGSGKIYSKSGSGKNYFTHHVRKK